MIHILVLEDEEHLNRIICTYLRDSGYMVSGCVHANEAYPLLRAHTVHLIVSDIVMPDIDGFEFARTVRKQYPHIPILFMSATDEIPSRQLAFRLGVDDYMTKPFELAELLLRVRALLRRVNIELERRIVLGDLELDADALTAVWAGKDIPLTTREFGLLYKLLSHPQKAFSRAQLMDEFWSIDTSTSLRSVDVYITKLREKFADCDAFRIVTLRGLGYKAIVN